MIAELKQELLKVMQENISSSALPVDQYSNMKYPKIFTMMRFFVDQYELEGFGHLMVMHTTTKMGMELLTMSFMPVKCVNLPYLLMDAMSMKKKRCIFVEYYGCGNTELNDARLKAVYEKYKTLPEYQEKENWYIKERMPYSLIKTGEEKELLDMAAESVKAYLVSVGDAVVVPEYREKLAAFRERMIVEGNPSSKTLKMLLKEDGARVFMEKVIMPV